MALHLWQQAVAIHAPVRERPAGTRRTIEGPVSPVRERQAEVAELFSVNVSIHAPVRERLYNGQYVPLKTVSIHAPVRERHQVHDLSLSFTAFQFTLP